MLFDKEYREIVRCVAGDDSRPTLAMIEVVNASTCQRLNIGLPDGSNGAMLATNGFVLVVVPVVLEDGDLPGLLDPDHIKVAAKLSSSWQGPKIDLGDHAEGDGPPMVVLADGSKRPRVPDQDVLGTFPDVSSIIPESRPNLEGKPAHLWAFDIVYLSNVGRAIGCSILKHRGGAGNVLLTPLNGATGPALVQRVNLHNKDNDQIVAPFGMLMPVHYGR